MTPERWQRVDEIFQAAVELNPIQRAKFLDDSCRGDEDLRREVESLLSCDEQGLSMIDEPAYQAAAGLFLGDKPQLVEGQLIGHYEIAGLIGKGGMGEVYAAKDKRLNRRIALKLLPADYTRHKDRLRRFQQEAQAASALNHPNILTIHELGEVDGQQFIATELVEGETLRERIRSTSLAETLDIAAQVASALAAAHKAGIVHRDIKPENIMLRPDGYVKVLDFGLAKLTEQYEATAEARTADQVDVSSGLVMGTVRYMSPEQARGRSVDARSDIFSLGVVLYEMLTGHVPFKGKSAGELIKSILKDQPPPLTEYLQDAPDALQRVISKALTKDTSRRYQTIEDLLTALETLRQREGLGTWPRTKVSRAETRELTTEILGRRTTPTIEFIVTGIKQHKTGAGLILTALAVVTVGLSFGLNRLSNRRASPEGLKITRIPDTDKTLSVAISPNGEYIAYAKSSSPGKRSTQQSLWVLQLATNKLIEIAPPAEVEYTALTYSRDGANIFYVSNDVLYKIPAGGSEAMTVLRDVRAFSMAPDGKRFAFARGLSSDETAVMVANLDGGGERMLATRKKPEIIGGPAWSPDGSLIACTTGVFAKNSQASVIGFDAATGEERKITNHKWDEFSGRLAWLPDGSGLMASVSEGTEQQIWQIPYPPGEEHRVTSDPNYLYDDLALTADGKILIALQGAVRSAVWVIPNDDPNAAVPITSGEHHIYQHLAWTPDGKILYASNVGTSRDVWIMNSDGTNPKQLTANAGVNLQPEASADGRYVVFSSNRANDGAFNLWRMDIDGSNVFQLTHGSGEGQPVCSPDGRWVVYSSGGPNTTAKEKTLWKVSIDGGEPVQLSSRPSSGAAISPDGALIACWYQEDSASQLKMALIPFAGGPPKILDATMSSFAAVHWRPDGKVINYIKAEPFVSNIWSQSVSGGAPQALTQFTSEAIGGLDWSRDGQLICSRLHRVQDVILITDFR
jgi:serine/threonine protein kinase